MILRSSLRLGSILAAIALIAPAGATPVVENFKDGEIVRHSVVLVRGTVGAADTGLKVRSAVKGARPEETGGMVHSGRFKALVTLQPGENLLALHTDGSQKPAILRLTYQPMTNPHYVRLIWLADSGGDTDFATPEDGFPQTYEERLITAALLMQSFTAERMHELGYGRRTFRLETDRSGRPVVHTVRAPQTAARYHETTDDGSLWSGIGRFLNEKMPDPHAKNMVLMAFTRKDPATGRMLAHTALGGGNLGLFGSASVFTWPESVEAAQVAFMDSRRVDPARVHEDSAGRGLYWAVASTTIGATLHEMGHTFGLPHCRDPRCIMTRGFDRFNRFFTFSDPWPGREAETFPPDQEAWFAPVSASFLRWSPWFQPDLRASRNPPPRPEMEWDDRKKQLSVSSRSGVRWLGFYSGGDIDGFQEFSDPAPRRVTLSLEEIQTANDGKIPDKITTIDESGQTAEVAVSY